MKRFGILLCLCLALGAGCRRQAAEPEEHPLSEEEQTKTRLDEVSTQMWEAMGLQSRDDLMPYLREHLRYERDGRIGPTLVLDSDAGEVIRVTLGLSGLKLSLDAIMMNGSVVLTGTIRLSAIPRGDEPLSQRLIEALDAGTDVTVLEMGKAVGKLGFEAVHEWGAGEDHWEAVPVIRFPDGTSYSVSGLLLIRPLLELYLQNEVSSS